MFKNRLNIIGIRGVITLDFKDLINFLQKDKHINLYQLGFRRIIPTVL